MRLHRSIFTQLFPYQQGEERNPTGGAFPAPAGAYQPAVPQGEDKKPVSPMHPQQPIYKPQPLIGADAIEQTPGGVAEQSVTIDENNLAETDQGQPMTESPTQTTQLQRLEGSPNRDPQLVNRMAEIRRGPMNEMEMFAGSGGAATDGRAPSSAVPMPQGIPSATPEGQGKKGKKTPKTFTDLYPNFEDPYPDPQNPQEQAANALARMQEQKRNPVNKDKGAKGLALELLENFLYGLGKTPAGADWKQALILGGTGAGAGFINKGWNEQRAAEAALPELEADVQRTGQMVNQKFQRDNTIADNTRQDKNLKRQMDRDAAQIADWARRADQRDFKMVSDAELAGMREEWVRTRDTKRLQLTEAEMENRMKRAEVANETRLKVAGMGQAGQTQRTQITAATRTRAAALQAAIVMYKEDPTPENQKKVQKAQEALEK